MAWKRSLRTRTNSSCVLGLTTSGGCSARVRASACSSVSSIMALSFAASSPLADLRATPGCFGRYHTRVPVLFTWLGFFGVRIPLAYLLTRGRIDLGGLGSRGPGPGLGLL